MHLLGPVEAETRMARLLAGELTLMLDSSFRAEKLVATPGVDRKKPQVEYQGTGGQADLSAATLTAHFAPGGWLTRLEAAGAVQGSRRSGKEDDEFSAENASLELQPRVGHPKELNLKGNVLLKTNAEQTGEARTLQT